MKNQGPHHRKSNMIGNAEFVDTETPPLFEISSTLLT